MEGKPKLASVEELKLSQEEGMEVLQNIEITEKNAEFVARMAEIQSEMEQRRTILKQDSDTKEILKQGKTEFKELQETAIKNTKETLTRSSKYVKGAVIAGISALVFEGMSVYDLGGDVIQVMNALIENYADMSVTERLESLTHFPIGSTAIVGFIGSVGVLIQKGVKAISQTIKTKLAANQKVQRVIAMMAAGMEKGRAGNVVGVESKLYVPRGEGYGGYDRAGEIRPNGNKYDDDEKEMIKKVREKLDEMGIKRISRNQYKG